MFRPLEEIPPEAREDPDYALRRLERSAGGLAITCSKCHHCR
jgi:hypothetical protein